MLHQNREVKEEQYLSGRDERAQPLHLRQRRRQEGLATLIKEKEQQAEVLKTKDRKESGVGTHGQRWEAWKTTGSGAQYP